MSFTSILFRKRACALASLSRATIPFSRGLAAVTAPKSGKPAAAPAAAKTGNKKAKKGGKGGKSGKAEDIDDGGQGVGLEITNEELDHRQFDKFLNAARGASRVKLDWSNEEQKEHARIATTFVVKSFVRHQKMQKDLADKIWLMGEAAMALPEELQAAAAEIDIECPPPDRPWPVWATPPIKGFDTSPFEDVDDDDDDEQDKMLS